MGFDPGINVGLPATALGSSYVNFATSAVFMDGLAVDNPEVDLATTCIADSGGTIFVDGLDVGTIDVDLGLLYVADDYLPKVFYPGVKIADYRSRLLRPGDTGKDISFLNQRSQLFSRIINHN